MPHKCPCGDPACERVFLSPDEAAAMVADGNEVHTFRQSVSGVLLGADWGRARLLKAVATAETREEAGPMATRMGHGLVIQDERGWLYVATKGSE